MPRAPLRCPCRRRRRSPGRVTLQLYDGVLQQRSLPAGGFVRFCDFRRWAARSFGHPLLVGAALRADNVPVDPVERWDDPWVVEAQMPEDGPTLVFFVDLYS